LTKNFFTLLSFCQKSITYDRSFFSYFIIFFYTGNSNSFSLYWWRYFLLLEFLTIWFFFYFFIANFHNQNWIFNTIVCSTLLRHDWYSSDLPTPRTFEDLRSFLGMSGYYRCFILDYAKIAKPFTSLLRGEGDKCPKVNQKCCYNSKCYKTFLCVVSDHLFYRIKEGILFSSSDFLFLIFL